MTPTMAFGKPQKTIPVYDSGKWIGTTRVDADDSRESISVASSYDPFEKKTATKCENSPAAVKALLDAHRPKRVKPKRDWSLYIRSLRK
jgi:hypothetical protein